MLTIALLATSAFGMALGSTLGIRGYKRRQSAQAPRYATIALLRGSDAGVTILNPLTGRDMAEPDRLVA